MKRFVKLFVNLMAVIVLSVSVLSLTACNDISTVEIKFSIYNNAESTFISEEDTVLSVDLYGHLAPETVKAIKGYFAEGYYNNAFIYQIISEDSYQYMVGDLEYKDGVISQKAIKPTLKGEFESNGVINGEIPVAQGSIGLWRTFFEGDQNLNTSSTARNTGRATLFLPTQTNNSLKGHVCMFGKFDIESAAAVTITEALDALFVGEEYTDEYVVYYTGTQADYDESKENAGLTFNCVLSTDFIHDEIENLFEATGSQLDIYNHYTIKVPKLVTENKLCSAVIKSVEVK